MQEIRFFEETLKEKVNGHVSRTWVRSVRFTLDRHGVPTEAQACEELKKYLGDQGQGPEPEGEGG